MEEIRESLVSMCKESDIQIVDTLFGLSLEGYTTFHAYFEKESIDEEGRTTDPDHYTLKLINSNIHCPIRARKWKYARITITKGIPMDPIHAKIEFTVS